MSIENQLIQDILSQINEYVYATKLFENRNRLELSAEIKNYFDPINKSIIPSKPITDFFNSEIIELRKLTFHNRSKESDDDYMYILRRLTKITFNNCTFLIRGLGLFDKEIYYHTCKFKADEHIINNCKVFEHKKYLYYDCEFFNDVLFACESRIIDIPLFRDCKFHGSIDSDKKIFKKRFFCNSTYNSKKSIPILNLHNCIFEDDFIINETNDDAEKKFRISDLNLSESIFMKKVNLSKCHIQELNLFNTKFKNITDFTDTRFFKNVNFKYTIFDEVSLFNNARIHTYLDFEYTIFKAKNNFLNIDAKILNRETARIIKNSFEQQNNIIEANRFYELEMIERENELIKEKNDGRKLCDWLVFKVHGLTSNHAQNWILPLFWIIYFTFIFGILRFINEQLSNIFEIILIDVVMLLFSIILSLYILKYKRIINFIFLGFFYFVYAFLTNDYALECFSTNINPFSIMRDDSELTFSLFIYKITIAYLIYQLIISVRQNTRRK